MSETVKSEKKAAKEDLVTSFLRNAIGHGQTARYAPKLPSDLRDILRMTQQDLEAAELPDVSIRSLLYWIAKAKHALGLVPQNAFTI